MNLFDLHGKVAIVTGSERGLGQGMALALAEQGADIVGVSYSSDSEETKKLVEKFGRRYHHIVANLIQSEAIEPIVQGALKHFGRIDILVNNAGIIKRNDAIDFTFEEWDDVMNINLRTIFFLSQAVAKVFLKQGDGGKIINVCSMLSFQGGIRVPSYTASKAGLAGITKAMANEWAKHNININAIAPGYMATLNTKALRDDEQRAGQILERIPAGRWGTPDDMKGAVIFLASKAADYVNGHILAVDGGWLAR